VSERTVRECRSSSVLSCGLSDEARNCATDSMVLTFQVFVFITAYLATGESLKQILTEVVLKDVHLWVKCCLLNKK
jgi:hypothetical protein